MITIEFKVIYKSGFEKYFYAFSFTECIILAMAYAIEQGWPCEISEIYSHKGYKAINIQPPTFTEQ